MTVLTTIGYIVLFILCLSVLIVVHEAGHFAMAKAFNVYCLDFSIGFGPALFHKKRKNGETYFSIRAFPLGGFVSMYGEGVELPEGVDVPPERSFENIKKWKRIIILFAGVFNNCILALIIFFVSEFACVQKNFRIYQYQDDPTIACLETEVKENSIASRAGIEGINWNQYTRIHNADKSDYLASIFIVDKEAIISYQDGTTSKVAAVIQVDKVNFTDKAYQNHVHFYSLTNEEKDNVYDGIDFSNEITADNVSVKSVTYTVTLTPEYQNGKPIDIMTKEFSISLGKVLKADQNWTFEDSGISLHVYEWRRSFGNAVGQTFYDFGYSAGAIYRSLGSLFTSTENWKQVGGIISIGVQTTNILQNMGIGKFLYVWGLISVNLAIINLLPFPGLDGWQILVLVVEMVAHKEIPEKVKNIVSIIGLVLLMAFAALILVKDIIGLF